MAHTPTTASQGGPLPDTARYLVCTRTSNFSKLLDTLLCRTALEGSEADIEQEPLVFAEYGFDTQELEDEFRWDEPIEEIEDRYASMLARHRKMERWIEIDREQKAEKARRADAQREIEIELAHQEAARATRNGNRKVLDDWRVGSSTSTRAPS